MAFPNKLRAILELVPNAEVVIREGVVEWIKPSTAPVTEEQIKTKLDELIDAHPIKELRKSRNIKLAETDWVVIKEREEGGSVSNFADWKTYRQALRDITKDYTSLDDVVWPEKP